MRTFFTMAALALLPFVAGAAEPLVAKNEWRTCASDAQCVAVQGICKLTAVNAAYAKEAGLYYAERKKTANCVKNFWEPAAMEARCRLEACEMASKQKAK